MRRLSDTFLTEAVVTRAVPLEGRMRAVTLGGPALAGLSVRPGQQVRIQVPAANRFVDRLGGVLRTYSIWEYDGESMHLRVFDHGDGPGAQWGREARPGDVVHLMKPQGDFVCRPSEYHLFAGDETASVAFGPMIRGLAGDAAVHTVVEVDTEHEQLPLPTGTVWLHRKGRPANRSAELVAAVAALDLPDRPGTAYLAGEAGTIQMIRAHLVRDRGWNRRDVLTKPFWAPGKTGMD
ncbi:siderophore-interacting protein [Actinoplanes couchii]|nr:siderophore-interacting protein [Actinoplanes couchii]MDR6320190.1 NADPH-dependent ferric siderophore reductase [Actinoplanes couchii]